MFKLCSGGASDGELCVNKCELRFKISELKFWQQMVELCASI